MSGIAGVHGSLDDSGPKPLIVTAVRDAQSHRPSAVTAVGTIGEGTGVRVAFDGALTETATLKSALDEAGHPVAPDATDADLALITYLAFGDEGFGRLAGTWAIVISDPRDGTTRLAVDAAGGGSVHYAKLADGTIAYASEPTALLAVPELTAKADDETVRRFLRYGRSDDTERTFFDGINAVRAGRVITFGGETTEKAPVAYVVPATETTPELADAVKAAVERIVEGGDTAVRLGYGVPGAVLAEVGGERVTPYRLTTGPVATAGTRDDDAALVKALSQEPTTVEASGDGLTDVLAELVSLLGEPVADLGAYATYALAQVAAKEGRTTLLDPLGVDDVLGVRISDGKAKRTVDVTTLITDADSVADTAESLSGAAARIADRIGARTGVRIALPYATPEVVAALAAKKTAENGAADALAGLLSSGVRSAAGGLRAGAPVRDWLLRLKNRVYGEFLSESFTLRPWFRQQDVLVAFEDFITGRNVDASIFWRLLSVELWAQEFLDEKKAADAPAHVKGPLEANQKKQLEITVDGEKWLRFPVRTELFARGDDFATLISGYARDFMAAVVEDGTYTDRFSKPWYLLVSEKVIAISQGRSYFIWDIEPTWWARTLSKYVVKTPYGIGLGSPWTMQLAIQEAGLPRILTASAAGAVGKVVGRRGLFYQVAGHSVRAIDGPTEYSAYPSNVSAKLAPAKPNQVAKALVPLVSQALIDAGHADAAEHLSGVVVIDANDIGRNVLGLHADRPAKFFEDLFADNPLGQGSEQTPVAVAVSAD